MLGVTVFFARHLFVSDPRASLPFHQLAAFLGGEKGTGDAGGADVAIAYGEVIEGFARCIEDIARDGGRGGGGHC